MDSRFKELKGKIRATDADLKGKIDARYTELKGKINITDVQLKGKIDAGNAELKKFLGIAVPNYKEIVKGKYMRYRSNMHIILGVIYVHTKQDKFACGSIGSQLEFAQFQASSLNVLRCYIIFFNF